MRITNVKCFTDNRTFEERDIYIENGMIRDENSADAVVLDSKGCYAIPGLVDMHFHGCMGADVCDGTQEALERIAAYEASRGITAICPATLTLPVKELEKVLANMACFAGRQKESREDTGAFAKTADLSACADLVGINMEGPFISEAKKGAQNGEYIIPADAETAQRFLKASNGLVKVIGIAPECCSLTDSEKFICNLKDRVIISIAHSNADYETAKKAMEAGASHIVHLYNGMSGLNHRNPGIVGAVFDSDEATAELITDGIHVHPAAVRTAFKILGEDRIIMISDSLRGTGMPPGRYMLGGIETVTEETSDGKRAVLAQSGTLAGSVTDLMGCLVYAVRKMNISLESAVAACTINPAKKLGIEDRYGRISPGCRADLVLLDPELEICAVIKDGNILNR